MHPIGNAEYFFDKLFCSQISNIAYEHLGAITDVASEIGLSPNFFPRVKNVIFSPPATIVFWDDGTKTVVKVSNEAYDAEKGLAMAFMRKILDNKEYHKWLCAAQDFNAEMNKEKETK